MTDEAAYHRGYRQALEDLTKIVCNLHGDDEELRSLRSEIDRRIERARCSAHSSLASLASGDRGY